MTFASFILVSALGAATEIPVVQTNHNAPAAPVVAPAAPIVSAPVTSAPTTGCCGAPAPAADCGCGSATTHHKSGGLFSGLFSRKAKVTSGDCGCAPAPAPVAAPCDPCAKATKHSRPSFFGSFFGGHKKTADCGCGCDSTVVTPAPATVVTPAPATSVYHGSPLPAASTLPPVVVPAAPVVPATPTKKLPSGEVEKKIGVAPTAPIITPTSAKDETARTNPY